MHNVHHVHVWCLDESNVHFEAHVGIQDMLMSESKAVLAKIEAELLEHGINHTTIQFEYDCCENAKIIINE